MLASHWDSGWVPLSAERASEVKTFPRLAAHLHCRCRCIAVCSLGMWVCEELMQKHIHHQVKDAISVLGVTLKVSDPLVNMHLV